MFSWVLGPRSVHFPCFFLLNPYIPACNVITRSHTSLSCGLNPLMSSIFSCRNSYPSQLEPRCQVNSPLPGTIDIARNISNTITPGNRTLTPVIDPLNPTPGSSTSTWFCSTLHSLLTICVQNFMLPILRHSCNPPLVSLPLSIAIRLHSGMSPTETPLVTIADSTTSSSNSLALLQYLR